MLTEKQKMAIVALAEECSESDFQAALAKAMTDKQLRSRRQNAEHAIGALNPAKWQSYKNATLDGIVPCDLSASLERCFGALVSDNQEEHWAWLPIVFEAALKQYSPGLLVRYNAIESMKRLEEMR